MAYRYRFIFLGLVLAGFCSPQMGFAQVPVCSSATNQCACLPPCVWSGAACAAPSNTQNACDDGTLSGTPSVVSSNVNGTDAATKFNSLINKKLACCTNPYDPNNPSVVKYDCVDNSAVAGASFDSIWTGTDPSDSGSQPYALALSTGGKPVTGFYTFAGARCNEFSEFAGTIQGAKVNPSQISGQQDTVTSTSSSPTCAILPSSYSVTPPASLTSAVTAVGKTLPYDGTSTNNCAQADKMRRCPILVRAALVVACPSAPAAPIAQPSYSDGTTVHCSAASVMRIYVRMEQIYEVAGMPTLPTVDTFLNSSANSISIANLLRMKTGTTCPGITSIRNSLCMGCAPGCGGVPCEQCLSGTYSGGGNNACTHCPVGAPNSSVGSTSISACGP